MATSLLPQLVGSGKHWGKGWILIAPPDSPQPGPPGVSVAMAGTVAQGRSTSKLDLLLRGQLQQAPPSAGSGQLAFSDFSFLLETLGDLDETGLGKTWAGPCEA